jgi:hypothetical protein
VPKIRSLLISIFVFSIASSALSVEGTSIKFAIIGDSLSTGAGAHPNLKFDGSELWQVFNNDIEVQAKVDHVPTPERFALDGQIGAPIRAWPSNREFRGGFDWVFRHMMLSVSMKYLNTEEYSWGYLVGRGLGHSPHEILIAGQDGARTSAIPRQVDRILDNMGGGYPEKVMMLFTGNDLCGPSMNFVTTADEYEELLKDGLEYLVRNGETAPRGTDVYLVGFLGVLQLLHADAILDHEIEAFGAKTTCRELRKSNYRPKEEIAYDPKFPPEAFYFGLMMPPNPAGYCPTLFGAGIGGTKENIGDLANRIRKFRQVQDKVVGEFNKRELAGFRFHYLKAPTKIVFEGDDVAGDCFHLSVKGQGRVAENILNEIR